MQGLDGQPIEPDGPEACEEAGGFPVSWHGVVDTDVGRGDVSCQESLEDFS